MSRASAILQWVRTVDEGDPTAFTVDHDPNFFLNNQTGYTYQDRGKKDVQGNTRMADGTKPAGMMVTNDPAAQGRTNTHMSPEDAKMMDVRPS
jgi:hypothetical protein